MLISGSNLRSTNRLYMVELTQTGLPPAIRSCTIYFHALNIQGVRGCVKSPSSENIWSEHVFISGSNPHFYILVYG